MHTEKTKRKNRPPRWYWAKRILAIGFVGFILFLAWVFFSPALPEEYEIKTSLDVAFLPTAEYLWEHPQAEYEGLHLEFWQNNFDNNSQMYRVQMCINMVAERSRGDLRGNSEIFLNNHLVRFWWISGLAHGITKYGDGSIEAVKRCSDPNFQLESGIHLIEVRMKYHPDDEPFHVHQWAFEIK